MHRRLIRKISCPYYSDLEIVHCVLASAVTVVNDKRHHLKENYPRLIILRDIVLSSHVSSVISGDDY